jgi:hypothetical protein
MARARHHFSDLKARLKAHVLTNQKAYQAFFNDQAEGKPAIPPAPDPDIPLIIGDAIHNARSSLDYLVCQLALLNGENVSCCEHTEFPIYFEKTATTERLLAKKVNKFVSADAFTLIEFFQPYNGWHTKSFHDIVRKNLRILSKLDIIDKHRVLVVIEESSRRDAVTLVVDGERLEAVNPNPRWHSLTSYAPLTIEYERIEPLGTPPSPPPKMEVEEKRTIDIVFANTDPLCDGRSVFDVLRQTYGAVRSVLTEFERDFFRRR